MRPKSILLSPGVTTGGGDPTDPEAIVRVLFEKSPLLIYISDLDFKIVLFNRALREVTGYDTSDCRNVGALLERFYPEADYRRLVQGIHDGWVKNEHIREAELVATIKDGSQRTISWSTSRLRIGRGPTVGYIAIGIDVTTRRNLQQWVTLFQQSLQYLQEGVILTDPAGNILNWSGGAEALLGYTDQQMAGRPLRDLYLGGERELIARTVDRAIETEGRYAGEVELEHKDGTSRIVVFDQVRLDGDVGPELARLTLLTAPEVDQDLGLQLEEAQTAADDVRNVLDEVRGKLAQREQLLSDLQSRAEAEDTAEAASQARVAELESMLTALEASESEATRRSEQAANDFAVKLAIAEGEAADAQDQLTGTMSTLATVQDDAGDSARRIAEAEHATFDAEKRAEEAIARAEAAEKRSDEALKQSDGAGHKVTAALADLEAARAETNAAKAESEAARADSETARTESEAATADAKAAKADAETARTEAESARADADAAGKRADEAEASVADAAAEADKKSGAVSADLSAATARADSAEKKLAASQELVAAGEENRLAAENRAQELEQALKEVQNHTVELKEKLEAAQANSGAAEELTAAHGRADELEAALATAAEEADANLTESAEKWVQERASLEDAHRESLAEQQSKAAAERKTLEEQLSRDILAAEERAEAERMKVLTRHDQERKEWQDAAEIARAEAESRLRHEADELQARLDAAGALQPHLGGLDSIAFVAADTEGRVIGWSGGAAQLDGRPATETIGAFIHKDVLRLAKVNWKTLFGKVVVAGSLEQEVTLLDRAGDEHEVRLRARLVRGDKGQPVGVTELLERPRVDGSLSVHTQAAIARMALPLHRAMETRAIAGLKSHQGASGAVKDLLTVAKSVHQATDWTDVEGAARRVDLAELLDVTADLVERSEDSWRELRATAQDLLWLHAATSEGSTARHRWNELVTRCLHAVEDGAGGGRRAKRKVGNQASVEGRGEFLVPLILTALSPIADTDASVEVDLSVDEDDALLKVAGAAPSGDDVTLCKQLADAAGGSFDLGKGKKPRLTIRIPLDIPIAAEEAPAEDDGDDRTAPPTRPMKAVPPDPDKTVPPSAGLNLDDLVPAPPAPEEPAEIDSDLLVEEEEDTGKAEPPPPEPPPKGSVEFLEEQEDGGLVLMAGEDSIVVYEEELRDAIEKTDPETQVDLPDIDELEQLFDEAVSVSPSILATADEMDAYAAGKPADPSEEFASAKTEAVETLEPPHPATDAKTDAGRPVPKAPDGPTDEVMAEMASTDSGMKAAGNGKAKSASKRSKRSKRKTKTKSTGRSKRKRT